MFFSDRSRCTREKCEDLKIPFSLSPVKNIVNTIFFALILFPGQPKSPRKAADDKGRKEVENQT
jgi:hypothetical protein